MTFRSRSSGASSSRSPDRTAAARRRCSGSSSVSSTRRSGRVELQARRIGYLRAAGAGGSRRAADSARARRRGARTAHAAARPAGRARIAKPCATAIERVGLLPQADRRLAALSGGQQQRAFIAKALAAEPELLVLDEPTTGVDVETQESLGALLERARIASWTSRSCTCRTSSAPSSGSSSASSSIRGEIVFDGPPSDLPGVWHDPSHVHA